MSHLLTVYISQIVLEKENKMNYAYNCQFKIQEELMFQLESEDRKKLMSLFEGHPGERVFSYSKRGQSFCSIQVFN